MNPTPSLASLLYRAKSTITNKLGVSNPAIDAIAASIAGVSYGQYAYQDYLFQQLNPETADEEWLYLWANRFKVERLTFVFAAGTVNFQLTQGVVNIPKGTLLKTADNKEYQVTTATNSDQPVPVISLETSVAGNLPAGVNLYLVTAVTGLNPDNISSNEISGGADLEDVEHWRERIVTAFNDKQIVGRLVDYEFWATSAHPDVDFAWALDNTPMLGHVTVYIGRRQNNPLLSAEIKAQVQTHIDANRLAGCHVFTKQPTLKPVPVSISDVSDVNTRASIQSALQAFINSRLGSRAVLRPNELSQVITTVTSEFILVHPTSAIELEEHELHTLGDITWL
ncbi:baseplate J/gp47 family protein [Psychromonas aquimarina]|uniref:baseplate J/gp47 family protein n=1 Tax=Psychromonas aquimarina TaxID=444919 RepID=UPI0004294918|nr:baseplate J/gp47 family protein [Psychromonas aquimarina]